MSLTSAKSFLERMKTDEVFATRIAEYKGPEDLLAAVHAAGFDFTAAEIREASSELSDEDLANVSGGIFFFNQNFF